MLSALYNVEDEKTEVIAKKETARERILREKEEAKKRAMEIDEDQLSINLSGLEEEVRTGKLKKYKNNKK